MLPWRCCLLRAAVVSIGVTLVFRSWFHRRLFSPARTKYVQAFAVFVADAKAVFYGGTHGSKPSPWDITAAVKRQRTVLYGVEQRVLRWLPKIVSCLCTKLMYDCGLSADVVAAAVLGDGRVWSDSDELQVRSGTGSEDVGSLYLRHSDAPAPPRSVIAYRVICSGQGVFFLFCFPSSVDGVSRALTAESCQS